MKLVVLLIALAASASACDREPLDNMEARAPAATGAELSARVARSEPLKIAPMPKDQATLDRMILAGYKPHGKHLDPPGAKECPLAQGSEAVM